MKKRDIIIFVLLVLLYFLLLIEVPVSTRVATLVEKPTYISREVTITQSYDIESCDMIPFRYSTLGGRVETIGNQLNPDLAIYNLEERWGKFYVNFSFLDEARFPFDQYAKDIAYHIDEGNIRDEDIEFHSPTYVFYLGPGESITLEETVDRPEMKEYWAFANIDEPSYERCTTKTIYKNVTENKTFTEYIKEEKAIREKRMESIKNLLQISFMEWLIICLIIILLIVLIRRLLELRVERDRPGT